MITSAAQGRKHKTDPLHIMESHSHKAPSPRSIGGRSVDDSCTFCIRTCTSPQCPPSISHYARGLLNAIDPLHSTEHSLEQSASTNSIILGVKSLVHVCARLLTLKMAGRIGACECTVQGVLLTQFTCRHHRIILNAPHWWAMSLCVIQ